jgi:two-component system sensor histidine kinase DesK
MTELGMSSRRYHDGYGRTTVAVVDPAPGAERGGVPLALTPAPREWTPKARQRWTRFVWVWAGIWLFYLAQPAVVAWHLRNPWHRATALAGVTLFAVVFIGGFTLARHTLRLGQPLPRRTAFGLLAAATAVVTVVTVMLGQDALALFVYVAVMAIYLLPGREGPITVLVLIVLTFVLQRTVPGWHANVDTQFSIFVASAAMWGVVRLVQRNGELAAAREEITRLAVEDERNRFARDLHDILGHSLTVVAVKAELAGRLVRLDPARAEAEIGEVEGLARQALADVRSAVAGFRDVTLARELANARTALGAAGIDADLPVAIDEVPAARRELFGWVVREGVTNVVRHSGASRCRVRIGPSEVEITDDGTGAPADGNGNGNGDGGHGLRGLRERAEAAGGSLSVWRPQAGGFALTVRV